MNKLKDDLDTAHKKLRKLMKDRDRKRVEQEVDEDGNPGVFMEPEDELIGDLLKLSAFIQANQEALKNAEFDVAIEGDWFMADEDKDHMQAETIEVLEHQTKKIISTELDPVDVKRKHLEIEAENEKKQRSEVAQAQRDTFESELEKNMKAKQDLIQKFKDTMRNSHLPPAEQAAMLAEMNAKISQVNDMISLEEKAQNDAIDEALQKRRLKKQGLREMLDNLTEKKG